MSNQKTSKQQKKLALLAGVLAAALLGAAITIQVQSVSAQLRTSQDMNNIEVRSTVTTSGTATTTVDPDKFSVTISVETNGTTAKEAVSANADLVAKVIAGFRDLGIGEKNIATSSYNVYPVYEHREAADICIMIFPPPLECLPRQVITGYKASSSLTVTLDADGQIDAGEVIDAAVESGANTVSGAYYFLSAEMQQQVRDQLIADAIANARHRADVAAEALGMEVSGVMSVNLSDVYFPTIYSAEAAAYSVASSTQVLPGQQDVSITVNVTYFIQ